jgi:hypothetical protein
VNADRRPVPDYVLAAVASGAMPLAVLADYAEDICGNSHDADLLRTLTGDSTPRDWVQVRHALADAEIGQAVSHTLSRQFKAQLWKDYEERLARYARALEAVNRGVTLRQAVTATWQGIAAVSAKVWRW